MSNFYKLSAIDFEPFARRQTANNRHDEVFDLSYCALNLNFGQISVLNSIFDA